MKKRNKFNLSHGKDLTLEMGQLVPIGCTEVLPGDTWRHNTTALLRYQPLATPVYSRVRVNIRHFFVPMRLVFDDWEQFITGGPDNDDNTVHPYFVVPVGGYARGSLMDYLGVPPNEGAGREVTATQARAYQLIVNEIYRDQDLVPEVALSTAAGLDTTTSLALFNVAWQKDYFTSARPWPQKGPDITLPLGDSAPVRTPYLAGFGTGANMDADASPTPPQVFAAGTSVVASGLYADLADATGVSIDTVRKFFALQRIAEHRARFGSRYTEYLRFLGVISSDARLQRPEYIGGGTSVIQFSEVLQTAEGTAPVGSLYGHGIGGARSNLYERFFEEHGYVISLMSVVPETVYGNSLNRQFLRRTREDYWQPELQHIGQQPITFEEVRLGHTTPDEIFGYQDRNDEYRRGENQVAGEFREGGLLEDWTTARFLPDDVVLNGDFVTSDPTDRIFAVPSLPFVMVRARHQIRARRLVAKTGTSFIQ